MALNVALLLGPEYDFPAQIIDAAEQTLSIGLSPPEPGVTTVLRVVRALERLVLPPQPAVAMWQRFELATIELLRHRIAEGRFDVLHLLGDSGLEEDSYLLLLMLQQYKMTNPKGAWLAGIRSLWPHVRDGVSVVVLATAGAGDQSFPRFASAAQRDAADARTAQARKARADRLVGTGVRAVVDTSEATRLHSDYLERFYRALAQGDTVGDAVGQLNLGRNERWGIGYCSGDASIRPALAAAVRVGSDTDTTTQRVLDAKRRSGRFDVFLCHNAVDKPAVKAIGDRLMQRGVLPWLDEWELPPGKAWQALLEEQIERIGSAAVFIGEAGIGPWQEQELRGFLQEFVDRGVPVIPTLLTSAPPAKPKLPIFLRQMTWVDFRRSDPDPLERLVWGITQQRPQTR